MLDVGLEQASFVMWVERWVVETRIVLEVLYSVVPRYLVVNTRTLEIANTNPNSHHDF